jgi:superfamily II DNA or RNA helicase
VPELSSDGACVTVVTAAPHPLRDYQVTAVRDGVRGLLGADAGKLYLACGTGKSIVYLRIVEEVAPGPALIVVSVPTIALVDQILRDWRRDAMSDFSALAVCSDKSAIDAPVHLEDLTAGVITDPAEVADWVRSTPGRRVVVTTYVSAGAVADALHQLNSFADVLVCDEAHHLTGRTDFVTRRILDRRFFPAKRRLFGTATPRVDLRQAGDHDAPVASMDDEEVFGPLLYRYPFAQAIREQWLCDYRLAVIGVSSAEALALLGKQDVRYVDDAGDAPLHVLATQVALWRAHQQYGIRRAITFHARVADAHEFARTLPRTVARLDETGAVDSLTARYVHGEMNLRQRHTVLDALRSPPAGGWAVISNARCLGEGVNIPTVDAVAFGAPKQSPVDIMQAIGRALRRTSTGAGGYGDVGEVATIVVPIIVDDQPGATHDLDPGDYRILWEVVRALRAHDDDLAFALDMQRAENRAADQPATLPERITIALPPGTADHILAQLTLVLVKQTTSPWWEWLGAARRYRAEHGHLRIPLDYTDPDGRAVGRWLSVQRSQAARIPERRAALDRLGMVWDTNEARWEDLFARAQAYHAAHGDLRVPTTGDPTTQALARWLATQRRLLTRGQLQADRAARLHELDALTTRFAVGLAACDRYLATHDDLEVPHRYVDATGFGLGLWLTKQRQRNSALANRRSAKLTPLTPDERTELTRRGMRWTTREPARGLTTAEAIELATAVAVGEPTRRVTARLHRLADRGVHHQALADALGVSTNTVKTRLARYRRTLAPASSDDTTTQTPTSP